MRKTLSDMYRLARQIGKHFLEANFTTWEDVFCTLVLFVGFIVIVLTFTASAYNIGWDRGETEGLLRGFASGTTYAER